MSFFTINGQPPLYPQAKLYQSIDDRSVPTNPCEVCGAAVKSEFGPVWCSSHTVFVSGWVFVRAGELDQVNIPRRYNGVEAATNWIKRLEREEIAKGTDHIPERPEAMIRRNLNKVMLINCAKEGCTKSVKADFGPRWCQYDRDNLNPNCGWIFVHYTELLLINIPRRYNSSEWVAAMMRENEKYVKYAHPQIQQSFGAMQLDAWAYHHPRQDDDDHDDL